MNQSISAQDRLTPYAEQNFLTSGYYGGGLTFINGDAYVRLQLQPDLPLGKIGIGFDFVLLYNPYAQSGDDQFLAEDGEKWDSPSTWLRLIRYISYAAPYDPFYFRLGEFDYLTIGHGSIMSGYSNHDRRGLHLNIRQHDSKFGIESMVNDLGSPTIFGARGFFRPLQRDENNNLLTRFEVGSTYITDIDPDSTVENGEPLNTVGVDVGFPIYETSTFRLDLYNDIAVLNPPPNPNNLNIELAETESSEVVSEDSPMEERVSTSDLAWGNAVGIGFAHTKALFKFEYRIFNDGYIPSVFDYTYESGMPVFWGLGTDIEARRGFFTQLIWHPLKQLHFLTAFENYNNNTSKIYLGISESGLIPRLGLRAYYTKRNIGYDNDNNFLQDLFDLDEKSALNLEIRYAIFPPVETIVVNEYRFRRVENDDGVSEFEPIHKTTFMVGVSTDF
ncbi:hypothetical protein JT359_07125 [Candidatus Poribacteria bacterium]|nr:hypothetical protein [Candidatus Poribacteria bacterium]